MAKEFDDNNMIHFMAKNLSLLTVRRKQHDWRSRVGLSSIDDALAAQCLQHSLKLQLLNQSQTAISKYFAKTCGTKSNLLNPMVNFSAF